VKWISAIYFIAWIKFAGFGMVSAVLTDDGSTMRYLHATATIQCPNEALLLDAALRHVARRGVTPGTYLEVRRRAPSPMAFDVETVVREALVAGSCNVLGWSATDLPSAPSADVVVMGDVIAVSCARGAPAND